MDNIFLSNKYSKTYNDLCDRARLRQLPLGYIERHHVIPRSFGGSNLSENLVCLTAREHYLAHLLLCKMTTGCFRHKMIRALVRMSGPKRGATCYEIARKLISKGQSGSNNPAFGRIWSHHPVTKHVVYVKQIPEGYVKGLPEQRGGFKGKQWMTDGTRDKLFDLESITPDGWVSGRTYQHERKVYVAAAKERHTPERDLAHSITMSGRIAISNAGKVKKIAPETLPEWINKGWMEGVFPKSSRAVCIENCEFRSVAEAARALNIPYPSVTTRLKSPTFSEWKYI